MTWMQALATALERRIGMSARLVEGEPRLARLAERRTRDLALPGPEAWARRVAAGDDAELDWLVERATIGFTYAGRDVRPLESLSTHLATLGRRVRVWSAGCSTGEEVWTLARLLRDAGASAEVLGTDLHGGRLEAARCADARPEVRFLRHNLTSDPPPEGPWDAIVCRNVTMYFSDAAIVRATERFREVLVPGAPLLLAPHEAPPAGWRLADFGALRAWSVGAPAAAEPPPPRAPVVAPPARAAAEPAPPPSVTARAASPWAHVEQGNHALAQHRFDDARRAYALALEAGPAAEIYCLLGVLHRKCGDGAAAEEAFQLALLHDDRWWPAAWLLGSVLAARGDRTAAERLRRSALQDARRWPADGLLRAPSSRDLLVPREDDHPLSRAARGPSPSR